MDEETKEKIEEYWAKPEEKQKKPLVGGQKEVMESELAFLKQEEEELRLEKEIKEHEETVKKLLEQVHPSRRHLAYEKIKHLLGGVKGTPEERAKRREKLKEATQSLKKFLEERKAEKEITSLSEAPQIPPTKEAHELIPESPLGGYAKAIRKERGE